MGERACLRDMTHDGNPDLLSLCLLPDSMSMVFLENRAPFHHGFRYIHTPWSGAEPRLAAVGGPVVAGNRDFRLRLLGAEGGVLVWNLLAWPPNDPLLVGTTALNVPPRLLFFMGKEFALPIPHDARFQGPLGNHYFQWLSPKLDRVSGILNLRFHP